MAVILKLLMFQNRESLNIAVLANANLTCF